MKNMIKRIIIGFTIALLMFFFKSSITHAKNLDSINLSTTQYTLNAGTNTLNVYLSNAFYNYGMGQVLFNFFAPVGENTSYNTALQTRVRLGNGFTSDCITTATYQINYNNYPNSNGGSGSTYGGIIYQAVCDVNLTNLGIYYIDIQFRNTPNINTVITFGNNITFASADDNSAIISAIQQYSSLNNTSTIITQLNNLSLTTGAQLQSIYDLINSQNTTQSQILQQQKETNDFLKDTSLPSGTSGDISDLNNNIATNGTISSLVTMPITFLQKIINSLNGSCSPITIGELYDYNMTMPCINPQDYIGIIWNIIDVICAGFLSFHFGKKLVTIFHKVTSMKDGGLEEAYD